MKISADIGYQGGGRATFAKGDAALSALLSDYNWFTQKLEGVTGQAIVEALQPTMEKAVYYCPKKTGDLAASAYLEEIEFRGGSRVELGFARGGKPDYAIIVHEMPYAHAAPTRRKYLQAALEEDYFSYTTRVAVILREMIASGTLSSAPKKRVRPSGKKSYSPNDKPDASKNTRRGRPSVRFAPSAPRRIKGT